MDAIQLAVIGRPTLCKQIIQLAQFATCLCGSSFGKAAQPENFDNTQPQLSPVNFIDYAASAGKMICTARNWRFPAMKLLGRKKLVKVKAANC